MTAEPSLQDYDAARATKPPTPPITTDYFETEWAGIKLQGGDGDRRVAANEFTRTERAIYGLGAVIDVLKRDQLACDDLEGNGPEQVAYDPLTADQRLGLLQAAYALYESATFSISAARGMACNPRGLG